MTVATPAGCCRFRLTRDADYAPLCCVKSRSIRISEVSYWALRKKASEERRTIMAVVEGWLGMGAVTGGDACQGRAEGRRADAVEAAVPVCRCGHPRISHKPKCLMSGCRCLEYKEAL